mmetsp:Transcript_2874/g.9752  ORF Transcript_2874/g.9752 Transcript_2874/m.9752 type:complete len:229 (-) Transcript_2874:428-1114(-)
MLLACGPLLPCAGGFGVWQLPPSCRGPLAPGAPPHHHVSRSAGGPAVLVACVEGDPGRAARGAPRAYRDPREGVFGGVARAVRLAAGAQGRPGAEAQGPDALLRVRGVPGVRGRGHRMSQKPPRPQPGAAEVRLGLQPRPRPTRLQLVHRTDGRAGVGARHVPARCQVGEARGAAVGTRERVPLGRGHMRRGSTGRAPGATEMGAQERLFLEREHLRARGIRRASCAA